MTAPNGNERPKARRMSTAGELISDLTELSIGEQFGRRHGQNWPSPPLGATGRQHSSYSLHRSDSRSRSKTRGEFPKQTSELFYKFIPPKPVMEYEVFKAARKPEDDIKAIKNKKVQEYYKSMNEILDSFEEVEAVLKEHREEEEAAKVAIGGVNGELGSSNHGSASQGPTQVSIPVIRTDEDGNENRDADADLEEGTPLLDYKRRERTSPTQISLAINVSFFANVFLVILKIWAVLFSDSLAVLASMLDSLMDLLSGAIIWYSARLRSNTTDGHRYPVGKARMEPLGIIVFASVMVTSFMQVVLQSIEKLLGEAAEAVDLGLVILSLLGLNILIKFMLWAWCRTMKDSPSVLALAQDHLNDVVFNIFSIAFPIVGQFLGLWWLDAVGAIILSVYIIIEWTGTCLHNIRRLTGQTATAADAQQLTYMTYQFSNVIQVIDTVRAYYVGDGLFVEVDIVLPPDTPLSQAHDLGESLQSALERLDHVERAFVHVDYNAEHAIEHRQ